MNATEMHPRAGRSSNARRPRYDEIAPGVARVPLVMVNAYLVGEPGPGSDRGWVLVDAGLPATVARLAAAAEARFGAGSRPAAVVLTHGHPDHVGGLPALARRWGAPIYAHPLEFPFLTGRAAYPPPDPRTGGVAARLMRLLPQRPTDSGVPVWPLPADGTVPGLPDWRWVHTPGHAPGHVSLVREADGVLLAGDAFATTTLPPLPGRAPAVTPPFPVFTPDPGLALESIARLATLEPELGAPGHGEPMRGAVLRRQLRAVADGSGEDKSPSSPGLARVALAAGLGLALAALWRGRRAREG